MNRLSDETSPYLLQHAGNPVDWYPWGEEALTRAREEDRPILLSIGYAACHWCHVMEHESFEDAATAALMNELFVSVKVDREERPDLDAVYMEAVVALSGHGGWPMTVFLTPAGEPFYGGTYYAPEPRHGLPSFRQVLEAIAGSWRDRRDDVTRSAAQLVEAVRRSAELRPSNDPLTDSVLSSAARGLAAGFEPAHGGWGRAPKFPNAPALEFLLRRDGETDRAMVVKTLDGMAAGGMYDLLGGGFHRYSVDERWLVPHFEKMLYDNALLAPTYLHGWLVTGDERYREVCRETVEYMLRELLLPEGGFASAQDADTDGVEGLTFTWTEEEGAPALEFLLRRQLNQQSEETARAMVVKTLDEMAAGGMYDLLGGGFHRYSVDDRWLVPHFEKMLYDNALLAATYLHGWLVTGDERYREVCRATTEYMLRELALPEGGFASAQDADTDGVEGLTFTWTEEEGAPAELLEPFEHGRAILRGALDEETRARLFELREQRPKPLRDDKAIASWNGLALAALAEAGWRLERPDWIEAARKLGEFLLGPLSDEEGRLRRSWRAGRTSGAAFLDDYANVAHGLLELHVATGDVRWLTEANRLARLAVELCADEQHGGFFLSPAGSERLV
ncbi:MAG: thioredoxin domain-containing protein, partial [Gaiellaceae bacterium]